MWTNTTQPESASPGRALALSSNTGYTPHEQPATQCQGDLWACPYQAPGTRNLTRAQMVAAGALLHLVTLAPKLDGGFYRLKVSDFRAASCRLRKTHDVPYSHRQLLFEFACCFWAQTEAIHNWGNCPAWMGAISSTPASEGDFAYEPRFLDDLVDLTVKVNGLLQTMDLPPGIKANLQPDAPSHSEAANSLLQYGNEPSMITSIPGQADSVDYGGNVFSIGFPTSIGPISQATSYIQETAGVGFTSFTGNENPVEVTGIQTPCGADIGHCAGQPPDVRPFEEDELDLASFTFSMIKNEPLSWELYNLERKDCIGREAYRNDSGAWKQSLQQVIWNFIRNFRTHNIRIHGKGTCPEARKALGYDDSFCQWLLEAGLSTLVECDLKEPTRKLIRAYDERNLGWRGHYSNAKAEVSAEDAPYQAEDVSLNEDLSGIGFEVNLNEPLLSQHDDRSSCMDIEASEPSQETWIPQSYGSALKVIPPVLDALCSGEVPRCTFGLQRYVQLLTQEQIELAAWLVRPLASNPTLQWDIFDMPEVSKVKPVIELCRVLAFEDDIETCLHFLDLVKVTIIETHKEGVCPSVQAHDARLKRKHDPSGLQNAFKQVAAIHADPSKWLSPGQFIGWNEFK